MEEDGLKRKAGFLFEHRAEKAGQRNGEYYTKQRDEQCLMSRIEGGWMSLARRKIYVAGLWGEKAAR